MPPQSLFPQLIAPPPPRFQNRSRFGLCLCLNQITAVIITDRHSGEVIVIIRAGTKREIAIAAPDALILVQPSTAKLDRNHITLDPRGRDHLLIFEPTNRREPLIDIAITTGKALSIVCSRERFAINRRPISELVRATQTIFKDET